MPTPNEVIQDNRRRIKQLERRLGALESRPNHEPQTLSVASSKPVQTTQATAKVWKLLLMFGGLGMLAGGCAFAMGMNQNDSNLTAGGVVVLLLGFVAWLSGRFGKFWFHD